MHIKNIAYPLRLNTENIVEQIETIGMAFNKYNDIFDNNKKLNRKCCSIALNKSRIISIGINRRKTHPKYAEYAYKKKLTIHAEIDMILNINNSEDFNRVTDIYVLRGNTRMLPSMPCPLCLGYLIKKFKDKCLLHYRTNDSWNSVSLSELAKQFN